MTALNLNAATANTPSTSGSYTFSVTASDIIRQAMLDNGALAEGDIPTAQEYSDCLLKLNMIVKQWMGNTDFAPGLKVWTRRRATLFLGNAQYTYRLGQLGDHWVESTAGLSYPNQYGQTTVATLTAQNQTVLRVASVASMNINDYIGVLLGSDIFWSRVTAINPVAPLTVTLANPLPSAALASSYVWNYTKKAVRPLSMVAVVLRDIYANDTSMNIMTVERYESLSTKTAPTNIADPTAILYESQFRNQEPNGRLYIDVGGAQDVTKVLHCVYLSPTQDLVNPGDAPDYPQQWFRPLVAQLSKDTAGMFEVTWDPSNEATLVDSLRIARQADPEISDAYFEVNGGDSPYGES